MAARNTGRAQLKDTMAYATPNKKVCHAPPMRPKLTLSKDDNFITRPVHKSHNPKIEIIKPTKRLDIGKMGPMKRPPSANTSPTVPNTMMKPAVTRTPKNSPLTKSLNGFAETGFVSPREDPNWYPT